MNRSHSGWMDRLDEHRAKNPTAQRAEAPAPPPRAYRPAMAAGSALDREIAALPMEQQNAVRAVLALPDGASIASAARPLGISQSQLKYRITLARRGCSRSLHEALAAKRRPGSRSGIENGNSAWASLVAAPACPRCGLRGDHECTRITDYMAPRRNIADSELPASPEGRTTRVRGKRQMTVRQASKVAKKRFDSKETETCSCAECARERPRAKDDGFADRRWRRETAARQAAKLKEWETKLP